MQTLPLENTMFGWLASHAASRCRRAELQPAPRRWLRMSPLRLARQLPQLGSVLYLPGCVVAADDELPAGLLAEQRELAPLLQSHALAAASMVGSDGPLEWLECFDHHGRLRARLHLLPDTDYLGWDALLAAGSAFAAPLSRPAVGFRAASARVLCFRQRSFAGLSLLEAAVPTAVSALSRGIAGGIARAEAVELRLPVAG